MLQHDFNEYIQKKSKKNRQGLTEEYAVWGTWESVSEWRGGDRHARGHAAHAAAGPGSLDAVGLAERSGGLRRLGLGNPLERSTNSGCAISHRTGTRHEAVPENPATLVESVVAGTELGELITNGINLSSRLGEERLEPEDGRPLDVHDVGAVRRDLFPVRLDVIGGSEGVGLHAGPHELGLAGEHLVSGAHHGRDRSRGLHGARCRHQEEDPEEAPSAHADQHEEGVILVVLNQGPLQIGLLGLKLGDRRVLASDRQLQTSDGIVGVGQLSLELGVGLDVAFGDLHRLGARIPEILDLPGLGDLLGLHRGELLLELRDLRHELQALGGQLLDLRLGLVTLLGTNPQQVLSGLGAATGLSQLDLESVHVGTLASELAANSADLLSQLLDGSSRNGEVSLAAAATEEGDGGHLGLVGGSLCHDDLGRQSSQDHGEGQGESGHDLLHVALVHLLLLLYACAL